MSIFTVKNLRRFLARLLSWLCVNIEYLVIDCEKPFNEEGSFYFSQVREGVSFLMFRIYLAYDFEKKIVRLFIAEE